MEHKRTATFFVSDHFGRWLISRKGAIQLLRKATRVDAKNTAVEINFSGVNFVSRSFADQLLKCLDRTRIEITLVNPNSNISKLFDATRKNYKSSRQELPISYPHYTVRDKQEYFQKLGIED